jgi:abhydrolase domain-containing protein 6
MGFIDGFIESGRFSLHFYERKASGSMNTLILLHGMGTSSSTWVRILPDIDATWNVLALDLPGFGLSSINSGPRFASMDELYRSVVMFFEEKTSRSCLLLGHSLGGWLAARFAAEHPENIKHLILVDNAGILCEETLEQGKAFQVDSIGDLSRLLNKIWFRYPWYFRPFYPAVLNDLQKRNVAEFVRSIHVGDFLNDLLRTLAMNTTVIWGKQDRLISMRAVEILKKSIPRVQVYLIDRCGHVPQLEQPKEFVNIVRKVLQQQV